MQNTTQRLNTENIKPAEKNNLTLKDIEKFYNNQNQSSKFGLEYERLSLDKKTLKNADYSKMENIISDFAKITNWDIVYDNQTVIGAKDSIGNSISLEPGCQMEISLKPEEDIIDIDINLTKYTSLLDKIGEIYDVSFLGYGISPLSSVDEIILLNKRRYRIMDSYLPNRPYGELCTKMMRQSAGIQVNVDYKNNTDAYNKLKFLNIIMPFVSGLFSNSPIENNTLTEYKSKRSYVWQYTGKDRCNMFYSDVFRGFNREKNVFKNYIKSILNVPMIFIERDDNIIPINGKMDFNQYLKAGYNGHYATIDDYILHQSLCFPDIRLKKCIEIRNHDSADCASALALCAFYKGLLKNDMEFLLKQFSYLKLDKTEEYFKASAKYGLDFKITKSKDGWDIAAHLFKLSLNSLCAKEKIYLNPILEMIKTRKTKADILIDYGFKSAKELFDFYS